MELSWFAVNTLPAMKREVDFTGILLLLMLMMAESPFYQQVTQARDDGSEFILVRYLLNGSAQKAMDLPAIPRLLPMRQQHQSR